MESVLEIIHFIGIISYSAAGAMVAIDKETDWFGVVFLSIITCFGGGMLRDVLAGNAIGRDLPLFFTDMNTEIIVCICTATLMFILAAIFKKKYVEEEASVDRINNILDALGLGVFAAAGTGAYLEIGFLVAVTMGMISSVGGSIIRDVILRDIPFVLRKHIYAIAALAGSTAYYLTAKYIVAEYESRDVIATLVCVGVIFSIRMLATTFKWNIPKAIDFAKIKSEAEESESEKTPVSSTK